MQILVVIGTRPEAIKMLPLVKELKKRKGMEISVCFTGQHKTLAKDVFDFFKIMPDIIFDVMENGQELSELTRKLLYEFDALFKKITPDIVLVHGDTTTAFCATLSAFYKGIKTAHIEAGLRTYDTKAPFPEEFNRVAIDLMSTLCFAPTKIAAENLSKEGKVNVFTVGNTVIDALKYTITEDYTSSLLDFVVGKKILLLTIHRRESIGEKMVSSLMGVRDILQIRNDFICILPRHPNPVVQGMINDVFKNVENIKVIDALPMYDFHNVLARSFAVMTDSGGVQEEAAYLGIPLFVLRDTTERREVIEEGNAVVLGTDREKIRETVLYKLSSIDDLEQMRRRSNAFGDGTSSQKIADILLGANYK